MGKILKFDIRKSFPLNLQSEQVSERWGQTRNLRKIQNAIDCSFWPTINCMPQILPEKSETNLFGIRFVCFAQTLCAG